MRMLYKNVVPGIHRIEQAYTNFYIVEDDGRLSVIDAGFPASWRLLLDALNELGFGRKDIGAIAITHAHFDHLGFAARTQTELGVPVWLHQNEAYIARHPYRYDHEKTQLLYPLRYPRALPILASMTRAGALKVPGLTDIRLYDSEGELDIPGRPEIIFTPGHTYGHCAFYFKEQQALLTGDALVTLNPYTAQIGPQVVAKAATADSSQALASLTALEATKAAVALPGHGEPWLDGIELAVQLARDKGVA